MKYYRVKGEKRIIEYGKPLDPTQYKPSELPDEFTEAEFLFWKDNPNATDKEIHALQMNPVVIDLNTARFNKNSEIDLAFYQLIAPGFTHSENTYEIINTQENIKLLIADLFGRSQEELDNIEIQLSDVDKIERKFTFAQFLELKIAFGNFLRPKVEKKAQLSNAVANAPTVEEVNAITVNFEA